MPNSTYHRKVLQHASHRNSMAGEGAVHVHDFLRGGGHMPAAYYTPVDMFHGTPRVEEQAGLGVCGSGHNLCPGSVVPTIVDHSCLQQREDHLLVVPRRLRIVGG